MNWTRAAALEKADAEVVALRRQVQALEHTLLNSRIRVELQHQALTKAEADAVYWRTRAERFIDQIALKERIIATPTMSEPPTAPPSTVESLLGNFGVSEINLPRQPPVTGVTVLGVDAADAQAAVADLLDRTGTGVR